MYGVVEISGHQYEVRPGDIVDVQLLEASEGSFIELDKVYFVGGENPVVGFPVVAGAKVKAKIVRHGKSRKILVFKRKAGKYQRKNGHRQNYTALLITELHDGRGAITKIDDNSKEAQKHLKNTAV